MAESLISASGHLTEIITFEVVMGRPVVLIPASGVALDGFQHVSNSF